MERQVQEFYELFVARVAEGRKLPREKVEVVAGGRVWTGRQALDRGLVDRLGSLDDAIALAAARARIERGDAEVRRSEPDSGASLLGGAMVRATRGPVERALDALPELRAARAPLRDGTGRSRSPGLGRPAPLAERGLGAERGLACADGFLL